MQELKLPVDKAGAEKLYDTAPSDVRSYINEFEEKIEIPDSPRFIRPKALQELERVLIHDVVDQLLAEIIFKGKAIVGVLLEGPPGVGKTETVMSVAAKYRIPVLKIVKGDIMSKYQGESGNRMEAAMLAAEIYGREHGKPVFLIIDELDTMVPARGMDEMQGAGQREVTNVLLNYLGSSHSPIKYAVPIGMTNRRDLIDEAVARRFGKTVLILPPDRQEVLETVNRILAEWNARAPAHGLPQLKLSDICRLEIERLLPGVSFQILNNVLKTMIELAVKSSRNAPVVELTKEHLEQALLEYSRDIINYITKGCQGFDFPLEIRRSQNYLLARVHMLMMRAKRAAKV
ncbi:MAG: AAA family ATPase [bacterium]|nr:AAA family ATPase [bacterium]